MREKFLLLVVLSLSTTMAIAQSRKTLDIYIVDVEGGNAVLFVTPSGESMLIDSGNGGPAAVRDAERIVAAAKDAGVTAIDHLITTHYHGDHIGGLAELASRIPIKEFIDHGPNTQPNPAVDAFLQGGYRELYTKTKHTVAKPGDKIPIAGVDWRVVSAATQVIKTPLQARLHRIRIARTSRLRPVSISRRTTSRSEALSRSENSTPFTSAISR